MLHGGFFIHLFSQCYLHVYIWHIVIRIEILMNHNFYQICLKTWKDAILRDSYTEKNLNRIKLLLDWFLFKRE